MKRLIRKSEFYTGFKKNDNYYEVFINPTSDEINEIKNTGGIRGVIYEDGTLVIWSAQILHMFINKYSKDYIEVDNGSLRFSYDENKWRFDGYFYFTAEQLKNKVSKNKSILSKLGDINKPIELGLCVDHELIDFDKIANKQYK
ncbi:MAG: hypothetical protein ACOCRK_01720 [bacterium]